MIEGAETKNCFSCKEDKDVSEFALKGKNKDKLHSYCKECAKQKNKEYREKNREALLEKGKIYQQKNKEKINQQRKEYRDNNKDTIKSQSKKYYEKNRENLVEEMRQRRVDDPEKWRNRDREYQLKNRDKILARRKERYLEKKKERMRLQGLTDEQIAASLLSNKKEPSKKKEYKNNWLKQKKAKDPKSKIDYNMSGAIYKHLVEVGSSKSRRNWESLVGYTIQELISHLESKFTPEMSWANYGSYWHIDHIVPKSWFDYTSPEDPSFKECWSLQNLQPLEKTKNLSKHNRFSG